LLDAVAQLTDSVQGNDRGLELVAISSRQQFVQRHLGSADREIVDYVQDFYRVRVWLKPFAIGTGKKRMSSRGMDNR